jgi:predicted nucleotidyltransferase component of viral defense system
MDLKYLEHIKRYAIIAMFSDDDLMDMLVLKGGNVLDLFYGVAARSSIDIDLSMETEFEKENIEEAKAKVEKALKQTFNEAGYIAFDIKFFETPPNLTPDLKNFWGGYEIEFKIIEMARYSDLKSDITSLRRNALVVGPKNRRKFSIQISKFEFCEQKQKHDLKGYRVYLYSPEMIVFEKIRAICQQMPEYKKIVKSSHQTARARDFVDIYYLLKKFTIEIDSRENIDLLKCIFRAKKVPLKLIGEIGNYREFHRQDFDSVKDTVKPGIKLKDFDYYFDYTIRICKPLKALWKI